ncbi:MAG: hypothetical protein Q9227_003699 [Pyrenula ochraceoflavens]
MVGHGTHVAGTIGSSTYGVAKQCNLVAVKVMNDEEASSKSIAIQGFTWAVNDIVQKGRTGISVISMSLGQAHSDIFNSAVTAAYQKNVLSVCSAGNDNQALTSSSLSPASAPHALAVGATTISNTRATYSNYGSLVPLYAPGTAILSTWIGSDTATNTISGTSMAAPHVAGLVLYLRRLEGILGADGVTARVLALATTGRIWDVGKESLNRLVNNGNGVA